MIYNSIQLTPILGNISFTKNPIPNELKSHEIRLNYVIHCWTDL